MVGTLCDVVFALKWLNQWHAVLTQFGEDHFENSTGCMVRVPESGPNTA